MESFMLFDTLCNLGEIPQEIEKKMLPLYEETYGAVVKDFSVSRPDKHSIVMTWKRTLSLPKNKQLIGVLDAELITGWTVSGTKPLAFTNIRPTQNKTGTVLTRSFLKRYKMMMKKNYGLNYNRYDISVSATDSELKLTIKFLPYIGVVYRYIYMGEGKYHGWSYVGETVNEKDRKRNWKKDDDKYANHELTEAKRTLDKNKWKYRQLDIVDDFYNLNDVKSKLFELEEYYIKRYNTREEGFNKSSVGTGNKDNSPSEETRKKIGEKSKGRIHTEETKKKISESNLGRHHTDIAKQKISLGNSGKQRTEAMREAQSQRMKGIEPKAASEAAKKWRESNGGGYWSAHKIPDSVKANMKKAQQKRGKAVRAVAPDGTMKDYNTMLDAAIDLGMNAGSISNNLKSKGVCNNGYTFREIPKLF